MAFLDKAGLAHFKKNLDITLNKKFANKFNNPINVGRDGQVLRKNSVGDSYWADASTPEEIGESVKDWMDENLTPTSSTVVLDDSLTQEGAAAAAKAAGNIVKVSVNKPVESSNRLWIEPKIDEIIIPTYKDLEVVSSTITPVCESDAENSDFDVSDADGNVVLRVANGHIQTKNFDSSSLPSTVKESSKTGVDLDFSDESGNVILRVANGHIQTKNFNSAERQNDENILTVKASGGDYTSIRDAIEAAASAGASEDNPYTIQIDPGTYDTLSYFTQEEINQNGFWGLMLTNGITLEGMGTLRDHTVLYADLDPEQYSVEKRNDIAALNFRGNVGLKNLTVKSKNMRYGIHDDFSFSSSKPKIRKIENCHIYAEATTSWNIGNVSYGAGTDGNKVFIFNDTDFGDTILIHTDVGSIPNLAILHNCTAFQFLFKDYASSVASHIYLYGCSFKWIREQELDAEGQHLFIHGDTKGAFVEGWNGMQYELGDSWRIQQSPVTVYPKAITSATTGRYHIQTTNNPDEVIGILYYYDEDHGYALVQYGGWICAEVLGLESPDIGQYLVVENDGSLSLSNNNTNAIGKVVFKNENNSHFIKLSI